MANASISDFRRFQSIRIGLSQFLFVWQSRFFEMKQLFGKYVMARPLFTQQVPWSGRGQKGINREI